MPEDDTTDLRQYIAELESLVEEYHAFIFKHSPDHNPAKLLLMLKTDKITERGAERNKQGWQAALELMHKVFVCYDTLRSETTPEPIREGMPDTMERFRAAMEEMAQNFRLSYPAGTNWCIGKGCLHTGTFFCTREQKWYCDEHADIMHPDGECWGYEAGTP